MNVWFDHFINDVMSEKNRIRLRDFANTCWDKHPFGVVLVLVSEDKLQILSVQTVSMLYLSYNELFNYIREHNCNVDLEDFRDKLVRLKRRRRLIFAGLCTNNKEPIFFSSVKPL